MLSDAQLTVDSDDDTSFNYNPYTSLDDSIPFNDNTYSYSNTGYFRGDFPHLLPHHSLPRPDGYRTTSSQSFIAPPSFYHTERPFLGSSFDSPNYQVWRRRLRNHSSPRVFNFEDDNNNVTLLTFLRAVQTVAAKIGSGVRKSARALFVPRSKKHFVRESDVRQQTSWICADFIANRLASRQLMGRKVGLSAPDWLTSVHVINATFCLESAHPETYYSVSKKLGMTMTSRKIIKSTLTLLLAVLFEKDITWGRIVSMFSLAGLFAEECVSQDHSEFVKDVFDVVVTFTDSRLLSWLVAQGGWDAFPVPGSGDRGRLSKLRLLILMCAVCVVVVALHMFLDLWG